MAQGSIMDGVRVIQGSPTAPLARPTLFLKLWKVTGPSQPTVTMASLTMARPGVDDYVIKDLIPEMEIDPQSALHKAIAVAKKGDVTDIYVNADLQQLPRFAIANTA